PSPVYASSRNDGSVLAWLTDITRTNRTRIALARTRTAQRFRSYVRRTRVQRVLRQRSRRTLQEPLRDSRRRRIRTATSCSSLLVVVIRVRRSSKTCLLT